MLTALIIKMILSIPDVPLLINILNFSSELKSLCSFTKVPDASQFSRLKIDFEADFLLFFKSLVGITEPICKRLNTAIPRGSEHWIQLFKLRTIIDRINFMAKSPMELGCTKLRNTSSLKVEVILAVFFAQLSVEFYNHLIKFFTTLHFHFAHSYMGPTVFNFSVITKK